jgi:hypothetical protein
MPLTRLRGGHFSGKRYPGDCDRGPREFQSDIIHHRIETKIQAVLAAGASKKTQIRSVLTAAFIHSRSRILPILDLFGVVPGPSAKKKNPARPFFNFPAIFNLHDL